MTFTIPSVAGFQGVPHTGTLVVPSMAITADSFGPSSVSK